MIFLFFFPFLMKKVTREGFQLWDRSNCVGNKFVSKGRGVGGGD